MAAVLVFVVLLWVHPALAQRLVFQQGDALYTATEDGKEVRKLLTIGNTPGALWAASPDGRRLVWLVRAPAKTADGAMSGLADRPATVRLSDITGRRQKRLFATDKLRDRQGHPVTLVSVPLSTMSGSNGTGSLAEWEPVSLSWSADGRTLYLSCYFLPNPAAKAMFAVDAATGLAVIDGEGRWKSIAPVTYAEARGGLIVGSGFAQFKPAGGPAITYTPLVAINLLEGTRNALYEPEKDTAELPDYAFASAPAIAPESRGIVFSANNKGLYLTDKFGKSYRRLLDGPALRPRWSADGKAVLCLLPRPLTGDKAVYDLYRVPLPDTPGDSGDPAPASPTTFTQVLQGVDWFDTVAE